MQRQRSAPAAGRFSVAIEDYLRALLILEGEGQALTTTNIAGALHVACASVTRMAQRLAERGLVEYVPYQALRFTPEGRRAAREIFARHRLMIAYLEREFGYSSSDAKAEADRLEHAMSPRLCSRIEQRLEREWMSELRQPAD